MCLCQFGQNPPIGSEDTVQPRSYADKSDKKKKKKKEKKSANMSVPVW